MSGSIINPVIALSLDALQAAYPSLVPVLGLVSQGIPVAESLWTDALGEIENLKTSAVVTPAQVAADDAALDAADAALPK
jgi:hypothetical protein